MDQNNVIEQKCFRLLENAIAYDAMDIHLIPENEHYCVSYKKDTRLIRAKKLPPQLASRMISFYKFLSSLDISDRRTPQSGSFHKTFSQQQYSFRVSTIPSIQRWESVVIRIQRHDRIVSLHQLCLEERWMEQLQNAVSMSQGLLLVTGPTGSGKTSTLYSLTSHAVNELGRHVISLEDPVENKHSHLLQIQVNEQSGMTYSTGLKAILRHSPDVIMIGEIRDAETAKVAVQASLTGHLVLTTVHSKDSVGCLYRMLDFGVSFEKLRQSVICISSQRLIRMDSGEQKAVFEIVDGTELEMMLEEMATGRRVAISPEKRVETMVKIYEQKSIVEME